MDKFRLEKVKILFFCIHLKNVFSSFLRICYAHNYPETIRFTKLNWKGTYTNIPSLAVGLHGSFLYENEKGSTI